MKVGVTGLVTPRECSFEETLRSIKGFGYDAFEPIITDEGEITVDTPETDLRALAAEAAQIGVELVSVCPAQGRVPVNLVSDDEAVRGASVEFTRKMLKTTSGLGIGAMLHTLVFPLPPDLYYDVAYAQGVKSLRELAPYCEQVGVAIAVEYVWNKFLNSPLEMRNFLDEVGSPWVGFYFDPANMAIHSHSHQWARICGKHLKRVHAKDFKFVNWSTASVPALLTGDVDFPRVMQELRALGFDGALVSEVGTGDASYEETATAIRKIIAM
jgi:L-ribulose-5-phosphate 3-epimerase